MFKFGIRNLRRLENIEPIEIRALTFLVGRNSSGKSSFLRSFPLLRQSFATKTSAPILWYGDLVDFESFKGSVSNNEIGRMLSFIYTLKNATTSHYDYVETGQLLGIKSRIEHGHAEAEYFISGDEDKTRTLKISLKVPKRNIDAEITLDSGTGVLSLLLNGEERIKDFSGTPLLGNGTSMFPSFFVVKTRETGVKTRETGAKIRYLESPPIFIATRFSEILSQEVDLDKKAGRSTLEESLLHVAGEILSLEKIDELSVMEKLSSLNRFKKEASLSISRPSVLRIVDEAERYSNLYHLFPLLDKISNSFKNFILGALYIGPARARSERYYRYQELAVSEIDPDGKNLPMFLNSLPSTSFESFSSWVETLYGYRIHLRRSAGHISIEIGDGKSKVNIVDTGYGVSQILPVLGQVWWAANRQSRIQRQNQQTSIVTIEQPELHLHPAHQALLADAFVKAIGEAKKNKNEQLHYMIETHSEALINRIGDLVADQSISPDDVQILIFEPDEIERRTSVKVATFDDSGRLVDWPYGFFQPT